MWEELYLRLKKHGFSIGSIWIADMVHQGQSFVLNENKLGNDREKSPVFSIKKHLKYSQHHGLTIPEIYCI